MTDVNVETAPPRPRRRRTRDALLAAGHRLLAERSIDALAIDEITQAAGVAKGSFYNHFEDKEALASVIREDIRQEIEAAVGEVNTGVDDPAERVARALATYMSYILASRQRAAVILRIAAGLASKDNPLNAGVLQDVAAGVRSGRFTAPSVEAGALAVNGTGQISLMRSVEEPDRAVMVRLAQQLCAVLLQGLGVPAGEAEAISARAMHDLIDSAAEL